MAKEWNLEKEQICVASLQVSFIGYVERTFYKGDDMS